MSDCILCGEREPMEVVDSSKLVTYFLVRDTASDWSLEVAIDNVKLGIAMTAKVPVEHCPECGRRL